MNRRMWLLGACALGLGACQREAAQAPSGSDAAPSYPDPSEVITPLYERYRTDPMVTTFPTLVEQAPWSAAMRASLESMMVRSQTAEDPILDFDPFVNAQDWRVSTVAVTTDGVVAESHATVRARFVNLNREDEVVYDLVWEGGAWRVDNIRHANWDLRQIASGGSSPP
ncbi:MAG: YbjP/YqhG family protein [Hyphomonadaceae bacterium]|nr:YbjP/YqhG family protein [Hyphomonadaceae bacterium]